VGHERENGREAREQRAGAREMGRWIGTRKSKGKENENTHSMGCGGTRRGRAAAGVRPGREKKRMSSLPPSPSLSLSLSLTLSHSLVGVCA